MMIALFGVLAVLGGLFTYWRPWLGVIMLLLVIPFDFPVELGITVFSNELLLAGVLAGWTAYLWKQQAWQTVSWQPLLLGLPWVGAVLFSAIAAPSFGDAVKQCIRWTELITVVWFAANTVKSREDLQAAIRIFIAIAGAMAWFGIVQSLAGQHSFLNYNHSLMMLSGQGGIRAYSTFGHPNQFAGYLLCVMPLAVAELLAAVTFREKALLACGLGVLGIAFVLTFTRGAWISAFVFGVLWLYLMVSRKTFFLLVAGGLVLLALLAGVSGLAKKPAGALTQRVMSLFHPEKEDSVSFRAVCTQTAMAMFRKHPWTGFGAGGYGTAIKTYFDSSYYAWEAINKHIHNLYLQVLIETGLLGLTGFLIWLSGILLPIARAVVRQWPHTRRAWVTAVLVGAFAYLMANQFDVLTIYARGIYFGVLLGFGLAGAGECPQAPGVWETAHE